MPQITILFITLVLFVSPAFAYECEGSYQNASYGLIHTEKAMEANNTTHLKEFALRAKIALEKVRETTQKCGCTDANYASYDAVENLEKALEKEKFEDVRFLVSRAKALSKEALVALDKCNANQSFANFNEEEENLLEMEKKLLEQQQQLLAKQQELAAQIEQQKSLQQQIQKDRELMLEAQKALQITAESNLEEIAQLINNFTDAMDCTEAAPLTKESFKRNTEDLALESLGRTKAFYIEKAQEMANTLINRLNKCDTND